MDSPVIQLRFKGRLVQTLSFQGDVLRIGRMRENDIVISNASVSRFHAVLKREEGRVILEDSGSENGCYVNGTRVVGTVPLEPGDEILIGKHQLLLAEAGAEEEMPQEVAIPGKSDAWDASNTYFVEADVQAKMVEADVQADMVEADVQADMVEADVQTDMVEADVQTDMVEADVQTDMVEADVQTDMVEASGSEPVTEPEEEEDPLLPTELETAAEEEIPLEEVEPLSDDAASESAAELCEYDEEKPMDVAPEEVEDLYEWDSAASDAAEAVEDVPLSDPEQERSESPFAFGIDADLASSERGARLEVDPGDYDVELIDPEPEVSEDEAVAIAEPSPPEPSSQEEPTWYAGLIIQNRGKLERIISWDQDRLTAGRSRECEVVLDLPGVSRRHVMFVREDGRYQVRDLDSINGVLVNGEKIRRRDLEVGDVVKVEGFELTFLLDRQPIASEIVTDDLDAPREDVAEDRFDMTMIDEHFPSSSAITDPGSGEEPAALVEEEVEAPDDSLFAPDDAEKEELVEVEELSPPPPEVVETAVPVSTEDVVTFELRVRVDELPQPLRTALAEVAEGGLSLPVELVLKTDAETSNQS